MQLVAHKILSLDVVGSSPAGSIPRGGGIGRHSGLRIRRCIRMQHAGSTPVFGIMICALSQAWSKASGCNPLIGGSNPSERSKDFYGALAELANALDRKSGDWGSNPRGSTDGNVVLIGKTTDWKSAVWKYYFHVEVRFLPFPRIWKRRPNW